jgi:hypothetical protein
MRLFAFYFLGEDQDESLPPLPEWVQELVFREGVDIILFTLTADKDLNPFTVDLVASDSIGFSTGVPMSIGSSQKEFKGTWDTSGRALGMAEANASAEDLVGHRGTASLQFRLKSSYGRHYGEAYGDGL